MKDQCILRSRSVFVSLIILVLVLTLLLVDSQNYHNFVAPNSDELLNTSDTTSREFGEQNHAINVVVLKKFDVCAHFGDLMA